MAHSCCSPWGNPVCSLALPQTLPGLPPGVSSFLQMAVSFTNRHLALFTDTGYIWMGTASLKVSLGDTSKHCLGAVLALGRSAGRKGRALLARLVSAGPEL